MSSTAIESLIETVQHTFDTPAVDVESGLDVEDGALLQLRKACRLLAGAELLFEMGHYTLVSKRRLRLSSGASSFAS